MLRVRYTYCTCLYNVPSRYFVQSSSSTCMCASYEHFAQKVFQMFKNEFSDPYRDGFTPTTAIGMIEMHRRDVLKLQSNVSVLLFVDNLHLLREECRKADDGVVNQEQGFDFEQDHSVLSSLCNTVEQPERHTVMISTLDNTALIRGALACV